VNEVAALQGYNAIWVLAANVLLHELGVPIPVTPTVLFLGATAAHGASDVLKLILAIVVAVLIGNSVWFAAGRRYGAGVLKLLCRASLTADTCVSRAEKGFGRWGWASLVIGRFLPGVSLVAPPIAGALGMTWGKFLALTAAGAALYALVFLGVGIVLRNQIGSVVLELHALGWRAAAVVALLLVVYIAWRWWRRRVARAPEVSRISVDELRTLIETGEHPLVVDVRGSTTQQIDPRQVPGAIAVSLDAIETGRDALPRDRKIVLYCGCPNEASAAKAARLLLSRGYPWARPLRGGLEAWGASGHDAMATS